MVRALEEYHIGDCQTPLVSTYPYPPCRPTVGLQTFGGSDAYSAFPEPSVNIIKDPLANSGYVGWLPAGYDDWGTFLNSHTIIPRFPVNSRMYALGFKNADKKIIYTGDTQTYDDLGGYTDMVWGISRNTFPREPGCRSAVTMTEVTDMRKCAT